MRRVLPLLGLGVASTGALVAWSVQAQDVSIPTSVSKPEIATVAVGETATEKLGRLVIMLTGADPIQTRLVEEALALQLLRQRIKVVSRLRVERLLAEEMVKNRAAREKDARKAIHATVIAKNAGATAILVGTVHNEARRVGGAHDENNENTRVIKCFSLQLVAVDSEEILWTTCAEFDELVSYNEVARRLLEKIGRE